MMQASRLHREQRLGLVVAILAHAGLLTLLVLEPPRQTVAPPPERMSVTLSDQVALTSTSPEPAAEPAPDTAPELGMVPEPLALVTPQPALQPEPRPVEPAARSPLPLPRASQSPAPSPRPRTATASTIGSDFLKGVPGAQASGTARTSPAAGIGPAEQASLASTISRQLKPRWAAPQGAEAEKLVTILAWSMNPDGSLAGAPRVVRQDGITDANRPQAARHAEQAIRTVQLAAPFDLPAEYYDAWKRVASFRFDRRLSQ